MNAMKARINRLERSSPAAFQYEFLDDMTAVYLGTHRKLSKEHEALVLASLDRDRERFENMDEAELYALAGFERAAF